VRTCRMREPKIAQRRDGGRPRRLEKMKKPAIQAGGGVRA